MIPPLWRIHIAYLRQRPWQSGLALLGIALGVMVVVAVQVALDSAREAFAAARATINGAATHRIEAASGDLPESLYARLVTELPDLHASPVLASEVQSISGGLRWYTLLGVDGFSATTGGASTFMPWLAARDCVVTATAVKADGGDRAQRTHRFRTADHEFELEVCNPEPLPELAALPEDVLLVDIATAQAVLRKQARLSHIDIVLAPGGQRAALLNVIRANLEEGWQLRDLESEYALRGSFSRAFDTNLAALSFSALFVGMFLVYNTQSFLVLQRRSLYARLRAIGVKAGEIRSAVLIEATLVGFLASLLGSVCGLVLANYLLSFVTATVNSFYFPVTMQTVSPSFVLLTGGVALGTLATTLAALPAAADAAGTPPLAARRYVPDPGAAFSRWPRFALGLMPVLVAATILARPLANLYADFALLAGWLLWSALLVPSLLRAFTAIAAGMLTMPTAWPEQLGLQTLRRAGNRTAIAASALGLAAGLSLGMQIMTTSFRAAVDAWLSGLLLADAYVAVAEQVPIRSAEVTLAELKGELKSSPALRAVSSVFRRELTDKRLGLVQVSAYDLPVPARVGFHFLAGDPTTAWSRWEHEDVVLVTEPFATRHGLAPGLRVSLPVRGASRPFEVLGVVRDYSSERGIVLLSSSTYARHWRAPGVSGIGVYLGPETSLSDLRQAIRARVPAGVPVQLRSRAEIRMLSLRIFDRTFAITRILGGLALAVAMLGVAAALLAQQLERAREYSLLRALGVQGGALLRVILAQTLTIGLVAAAAALPVGLGCGWYLVRFISLHAFGWTMPLSSSPALLGGVVGGVIATSVLAALYPAMRAARLAPARALRDE